MKQQRGCSMGAKELWQAGVIMAEPLIVGIGGPSGSGKTTIADEIVRRFGPERCAMVRLDDYYRDLAHIPADGRAKWNFDTPDAIEFELLIAHVEALLRGATIAAPMYDFTNHTRRTETRQINARPVVIVEGTMSLYWRELRAAMGVRAYVHTDAQLCFERRSRRDTEERGRSAGAVLEQWRTTVWPMHTLYVLPTMAYADVILDGSDPVCAAEVLAARIADRLPNEVVRP